MATTERILTRIDAANGARQIASPSHRDLAKPVWRQVALDLLSISACLTLFPAVFKEHIAWSAAGWPGSPVVATLLIVTIFLFTGAYPHQRTPLDIGDTEGLMRGLCCVVALIAIFSIGTHVRPSLAGLGIAGSMIIMLATQREFAHTVRAHNAVATATQPEFAMLPLLGWEDIGRPKYERTTSAGLGRPSRVLKRCMDISGAAILLAATLPLITVVAVLIKFDSRGPVFILQRRIGEYGVPFYMWKFRTMHAYVERYARSPVSDADPRLTYLGRALRRFSIDELPQLLNVLKGDMSLVGPRPEMPFIVCDYLPHQRLRLNAVPGITGLWQISPARAAPIHVNLHLDLFYIEHQNFFLDLAILLRTVTAIFRGIGAI